MAIPPRRGVGFLCIFLSPGRSTKPFLRQTLLTTGTIITARKKAMRKPVICVSKVKIAMLPVIMPTN